MKAKKISILHLTLKKKWYVMIDSGEKKEEYREIKPYWVRRLMKAKGRKPEQGRYFATKYNVVQFRNGYRKNSPTMQFAIKGMRCDGAKPEWSDNWKGYCFVIEIGKRIK